MKIKSLLLTALAVILITNINAQEIKYGAQLGIGVSSHDWMFSEQSHEADLRSFYKSRLSWGINAYGAYKSNAIWGVSVEPGYLIKGVTHFYEDSLSNEINSPYNLHYLQCPILFDLYFLERFSFSIGPEFSYMISGKVQYDDQTYDLTKHLYENMFEVSLQAGFSCNVWQGIDVGLRYSQGLTYLYKVWMTDMNGDPLTEAKTYNQYGHVFLRYKF